MYFIIIVAAVDVEVNDDFKNYTATILPGHNCTAFDTVDDLVYERSKVFVVTLALIVGDEDDEIQDQSIFYTIILQDDDGEELT